MALNDNTNLFIDAAALDTDVSICMNMSHLERTGHHAETTRGFFCVPGVQCKTSVKRDRDTAQLLLIFVCSQSKKLSKVK